MKGRSALTPLFADETRQKHITHINLALQAAEKLITENKSSGQFPWETVILCGLAVDKTKKEEDFTGTPDRFQ